MKGPQITGIIVDDVSWDCWRGAYRCRVDPNPHAGGTFYIFDRDEDYTWFMLRWA